MQQRSSSTREIPNTDSIPQHIAIIMDGNGRWARNRFMPRVAGHRQGVETVRVVSCCIGFVVQLFVFPNQTRSIRRGGGFPAIFRVFVGFVGVVRALYRRFVAAFLLVRRLCSR